MTREKIVSIWKSEYGQLRTYSLSRGYFCINVLSLNYYVVYNNKCERCISFSKSYYTLNDIRKLVSKKALLAV